jgi:Family of unknown function (DUF6519)
MSTNDISRYLSQPRKGYSSVLMQQGRVILDSDWNERERIDDEEARRTLIDVICSHGTSNQGFRVGNVQGADVAIPGANTAASYNFNFENGSFYIGGLRFESETDETPETFLGQNDWLQIDASANNLPLRPDDLPPGGVRHDLIYLRGWEQCVTAVEDSELLERALGVDSSVRVRRFSRVEALTNAPDTCAAAFNALKQRLTAPVAPDTGTPHEFDLRNYELKSKARLTVTPNPADITEDPCKPVVAGGYLGADNQTIRVQLTATNRFIWGYDNAAPLYRVQVENVPDAPNGIRRKIRFLSLPRDRAAQPAAGHVVEIIPWGALLPNKEKVAEFQGELFIVETSFDPEDGSLTITQPVPQELVEWLATHPQFESDRDEPEHQQYFYLRLWTGGAGDVDSPYHEFTPGAPVSLEGTGLSVTFRDYGLPGDFWIIAARPNTPNLVVPWELLDSAPPAGPRYFFAPLALIRWRMGDGAILQTTVNDCRERFRPLCDLRGCCTLIVGDGVSSHGDFDSIEEAVEALPDTGGEICLLPGQHRANVTIVGRRDITIKGCGKQTRVVPRESNLEEPIFNVFDSQGITLREMELVTLDGTAIAMARSVTGSLKEISIVDNRILAGKQAIQLRQGVKIQIRNNHIRVLDKEGAGVAVQLQAEDSVIEHNNIGVIPAEQTTPPDEAENIPDPTGPDVDREIFYGNPIFLGSIIDHIFRVIIADPPIAPFKALGGIQIAGASERVKVLDNSILGGAGNGITLGSEPPAPEEEPPFIIESPGVPTGGPVGILGVVQRDGVGLQGIVLSLEGQSGELLLALSVNNGLFIVEAKPRSFTERYTVSLLSPGFRIESIVLSGGLFAVTVVNEAPEDPEDAFAFLNEIQIDHNEISRMGLSGIGFPIAASVILGPTPIPTAAPPPNPARAALLDRLGNPVVKLGIHRNHIHDCLQNPFDGALRAEARRRGFGGISLGVCENVTIGKNRIERNGANHINPACGIFIMECAKLDIYHNHILDNGPLAAELNQDLEPGFRGGMVLVATAVGTGDLSGPGVGGSDIGMHAARLHGNIVHQPAGNALRIFSLGPVSICDNRFGAEISGPESLGSFFLGGAVTVTSEGGAPLLPDGLVMFNNNQSLLGQQSETSISQLIIATGDIGFNGNQSIALTEGVSVQSINVHFMNTLLVGQTIRATDNRFKEPPRTPQFSSKFSLATLSLLLNNTSNNQCDNCIISTSENEATPLVTTGNQIVDDEGCNSLATIAATVMSAFTPWGPINRD